MWNFEAIAGAKNLQFDRVLNVLTIVDQNEFWLVGKTWKEGLLGYCGKSWSWCSGFGIITLILFYKKRRNYWVFPLGGIFPELRVYISCSLFSVIFIVYGFGKLVDELNITKLIRSQHIITTNYQSKDKSTLISTLVISQHGIKAKMRIRQLEDHSCWHKWKTFIKATLEDKRKEKSSSFILKEYMYIIYLYFSLYHLRLLVAHHFLKNIIILSISLSWNLSFWKISLQEEESRSLGTSSTFLEASSHLWSNHPRSHHSRTSLKSLGKSWEHKDIWRHHQRKHIWKVSTILLSMSQSSNKMNSFCKEGNKLDGVCALRGNDDGVYSHASPTLCFNIVER